MSFDGGARGCQSQAAAEGAVFRLLHAIKAVEDALQVLRRDASALIGDAEAHLGGALFKPGGDAAAQGRVDDGVVEQLIDDLLNTQRVTLDGAYVLRAIRQ